MSVFLISRIRPSTEQQRTDDGPRELPRARGPLQPRYSVFLPAASICVCVLCYKVASHLGCWMPLWCSMYTTVTRTRELDHRRRGSMARVSWSRKLGCITRVGACERQRSRTPRLETTITVIDAMLRRPRPRTRPRAAVRHRAHDLGTTNLTRWQRYAMHDYQHQVGSGINQKKCQGFGIGLELGLGGGGGHAHNRRAAVAHCASA